MSGERLDLSSDVPRDRAEEAADASAGRRFVGVRFECCSVYARIYANRDASAYEGHCPRCAKRVRLAIGPGGTDSRFFTAH